MRATVPELRRAVRRLRKRARRARRVEASLRVRPSFGPEWVRTYLPHYFASAPADFHGELFARLRDLHTRRNSKEAIIAPREGAKSTVITLAYVLFCALERHEPFALILSDSAGQAQEQLGHVKHEIEANETIARDYPATCGVGPVWRKDRIELRNGSVIAALGSGGRVRGRRARQARPSLVVFDDVENQKDITSETMRSRSWRWATREVIPAGSATTNFLSVGSALHREAVALRLGQLPGWTGRTYPAVLRWPARMDLWSQWEGRATNLADPDRERTAELYYTERRAEMDTGAVVYWPERWPLLALMRRRAEIGAAAFDTEYQGIPSVEGLTEWPASYFDKPELWFDEWPADLLYRVQSLDPSKGADAKTGDYQAHVLLGLARSGELFVEAVLAHDHPPEMIARSLDLAAGFRPLDTLIVEENATLGMIYGLFKDEIVKRKVVVPFSTFNQTQNKLERIRRLGLYFGRGRVRFRNTRGTRMLADQLRDFPSASHDDGPDALELAVRTLESITNDRRFARR